MVRFNKVHTIPYPLACFLGLEPKAPSRRSRVANCVWFSQHFCCNQNSQWSCRRSVRLVGKRPGSHESFGDLILLRGCSDWQSQLPCTLQLLHLRSMATGCGRIFIILVSLVKVRGGGSMLLSQMFSFCPSSLEKHIKNTTHQRGLFKLK